MISSSLRHKIAVVLLAAALVAPTVSAAEPRFGPRSAWSLLERAWNGLLAIWSEAGCTIDPSGKCAPAGPSSDNGCTIDPNGKCAAGASHAPVPGESLDEGCTLDPSGKCYSGS